MMGTMMPHIPWARRTATGETDCPSHLIGLDGDAPQGRDERLVVHDLELSMTLPKREGGEH